MKIAETRPKPKVNNACINNNDFGLAIVLILRSQIFGIFNKMNNNITNLYRKSYN